MKKVLALMLAVMMLATFAFADTNISTDENKVSFGGTYAPGDNLYMWKGMDSNASGTDMTTPAYGAQNAEINSTNYSKPQIKGQIIGKDLFAGFEFDDKNNQLKIKLTEDYTLKKPQQLKFTFTMKGKGKGGAGDKTPVNYRVDVDIKVGNWQQEVKLDDENDVTIYTAGKHDGQQTCKTDATINAKGHGNGTTLMTPSATATGSAYGTDDLHNNAVVKFTGTSYGTVVVNCADNEDTEVTFRAYKGDEVYLFNNGDADKALLKAYADEDAEISFLNFPANPTLNSTATVRFYKGEDTHVYEMKNGKLTKEIKWDSDEDCFILKTRTLGNYVFSDKALPFNVETTANPDTGANDVVGIATALAAVALVSAAAVSLKK